MHIWPQIVTIVFMAIYAMNSTLSAYRKDPKIMVAIGTLIGLGISTCGEVVVLYYGGYWTSFGWSP